MNLSHRTFKSGPLNVQYFGSLMPFIARPFPFCHQLRSLDDFRARLSTKSNSGQSGVPLGHPSLSMRTSDPLISSSREYSTFSMQRRIARPRWAPNHRWAVLNTCGDDYLHAASTPTGSRVSNPLLDSFAESERCSTMYPVWRFLNGDHNELNITLCV